MRNNLRQHFCLDGNDHSTTPTTERSRSASWQRFITNEDPIRVLDLHSHRVRVTPRRVWHPLRRAPALACSPVYKMAWALVDIRHCESSSLVYESHSLILRDQILAPQTIALRVLNSRNQPHSPMDSVPTMPIAFMVTGRDQHGSQDVSRNSSSV
jgi:hypothetical protein